jgi:hypothetical protein
VHELFPQLVPLGVFRQPPLPSHLASCRQPFAVHIPAVFGFWPLGMGEQVPSATPFVARAQEEQPPVQALLQQTPSTHWPFKHSVPV